MLGAARHSQGSGEYFPTARTVPFSWRGLQPADDPYVTTDNAWREITPISIEGSSNVSVDIGSNWTLAYWFKFVNESQPGGVYTNFAQPINTGKFGPAFTAPWVSKTAIGFNNINDEFKAALATINLTNNVWYSAIFTSNNTIGFNAWINGQRVYTGTHRSLSPIWQDDYPTISNNLLRAGVDGSRYADCWILDQAIDFTVDRNKLRFFYDYRIGAPAVSGGLSAQQDTTNLVSGNNRQDQPYPPPYPDSWDMNIGSWIAYPGAITTGDAINPTRANSGFNISFTDAPGA